MKPSQIKNLINDRYLFLFNGYGHGCLVTGIYGLVDLYNHVPSDVGFYSDAGKEADDGR